MSNVLEHSTCAAADRHFMAAALRLGRVMLGKVWPNPAVGCVIVRNGVVVGRGQTQPGGRPHAERVALADAGSRAIGATAYVTLEPCSHCGKTPPCTDALIRAGIRRVVVAVQDPDPRVNGGGLHQLREAGIEVVFGLGARAAALAHAGFFHRLRTGRPRLIRSDAAARWVDARVNSRSGAAFGTLQQGATALSIRLQLAHPRVVAGSMEHLEEADAQAIMLRLGRFGLTNVTLSPADPLYPLFTHFYGTGIPTPVL